MDADFNLSPQGDGNVMSLVLLATLRISTSPRKETETAIVVVNNDDLVAFQLIPARGRKQRCPCPVEEKLNISTYPRKGTETYSILQTQLLS